MLKMNSKITKWWENEKVYDDLDECYIVYNSKKDKKYLIGGRISYTLINGNCVKRDSYVPESHTARDVR